MTDACYWLWLSYVLGPGAAHCRRLLDVYGSARAVHEAVGKEDFSDLLTPSQCGRLSTDPAVFAPMEARCVRMGAQVLTMADPDYPSRLMDIEDAPPALFVTGEVSALNAGHTVGMIGCLLYTSTWCWNSATGWKSWTTRPTGAKAGKNSPKPTPPSCGCTRRRWRGGWQSR